MEMERNVELGINKDIVNSLIKYHFIRLTNIAAGELGTKPEVTWDILKATQLVVQAAKFAQKLDYHRCYAIILDLEGMDQHTNYKDLKDSLTVLKKVYATQEEAALLEPVQVSHTFPVVKVEKVVEPEVVVERPKDEYPETGDKGVSTSIIVAGALVAMGLMAVASTKR